MISIDRYRFGVNYTPSQKWWYCWNDFSRDEIARDLDTIAELHADHIRIMAMWTYFQPNPSWVSPAHLEHLRTLMELAAERKLDVCVSLFIGHLTGQHYHQGYEFNADFFTDENMLSAQKLFIEKMSAVLNPFDNFLGFDVGNEMNCCWKTPRLETGDAWNARIISLMDRLSPGKIHVNGVDHAPWFHPATFSPRALTSSQVIVPIHSWIRFTGALQRSGGDPLGELCLGLIPAMTALVRAYARNPRKPVWVQEFGASEEWMSAEIIPEFLERSILNAIAGGTAWFTCWASHDIDRKFKVNPLEYSLGLIDIDQNIKPQGQVFSRLAAEYCGKEVRIPDCRFPDQEPAGADDALTWEWLSGWLESNRALF